MSKPQKVLAELVTSSGRHEYVEVTLREKLRVGDDGRPYGDLEKVFEIAIQNMRDAGRVGEGFDAPRGLTVLVPFNDPLYGPRIAMAREGAE